MPPYFYHYSCTAGWFMFWLQSCVSNSMPSIFFCACNARRQFRLSSKACCYCSSREGGKLLKMLRRLQRMYVTICAFLFLHHLVSGWFLRFMALDSATVLLRCLPVARILQGILGVRLSELSAEWRRLYGCDLEAPMRHAGYPDVRLHLSA